MIKSSAVRPPAVAGQFYTDNPEELRAEIVGYLRQASPPAIKGRPIGLIAPHAGYMYSGPTAAHAYKYVEGLDFPAVVVVAPSHQDAFNGVSVYSGSAYETPLGKMEIDQALVRQLIEQHDCIRAGKQGHGREHSLEVQVPFLQVVLGKAALVPVVMGDQGRDTCRALGEALAMVAAQGPVLLVASSDLSHFHTYQQARELDAVVNRHINAFDPEGLARALANDQCEACGGGPMVAVMLAARALGATTARVAHHVNSGDVSGDKQGVVGYTAAVIYHEQ
jgi:AmmeMemoRadiSam system protein B